MWCSTMQIVMPCSFRSAISWTRPGTSSIDTPAIGSSSSRTSGRLAIATASSSFRLSPWDRAAVDHDAAMTHPDLLQQLPCLLALTR